MSVLDSAQNALNVAEQLVENQVGLMTARSDASIATTNTVISQLANAVLVADVAEPPAIPDADISIDDTFNLPEIGATSFGEITAELPSPLVLGAVPNIATVSFPTFTSSITPREIDAPVPTSFQLPDRPATDAVVIPDAPTFDRPVLPELQAITIPTFTFPTIADFGEAAPTLDANLPATALQWDEPVYQSEVLDEVIEQLRAMWSGGSGLPAAVEQAMWERAASREDQAIARDVAAVATEFSNRGFTMPTGMQAARADAIREEGLIKKLALNRDITIEVAKFHVENLRLAVTQGIAAENVLANIFMNSAQRVFEAARYSVQSQIELYGAQVAAFNASMNGYSIRAQVYKTNLDARLASIEVYKAQIQGEIARGTINEQRVNAYTALVNGLRADVEIYAAQMEGAKTQAEVVRAQIEGYKVDVEAYATLVSSDKLRFDAYDSQMRGEAARANMMESEARVYASVVQGRTAEIEASIQTARVAIDNNRSSVEAYRASLEAATANAQIQGAAIDAGARAYVADTQRYVAQAGAEGERSRTELAAQETALRSNIALYQARIQQYVAKVDLELRRAGLHLDALKSAGQMASTVTAGAMAAVHVGATLSGSGGMNGSTSFGFGKSASESYTYNVSSTETAAGLPLTTGGLANQPW